MSSQASHLSGRWNSVACYLELHDDDGTLASGSGFFWRHNERVFLVTNWHNFAGINPLSGTYMSPSGRTPKKVVYWTYRIVSGPDSNGFIVLDYLSVESALVSSRGSPLWFEHPRFEHKVDVGAVDVTEAVAHTNLACANEAESDAVIPAWVSQDVFIVGFPFGRLADAPAPIHKRGTMALAPTYDLDGLPKTLVDTATREGMSGSLVYARHDSIGRYQKKDGTVESRTLFARLEVLVGIYSGRLYPSLDKAQLGVVWKRVAIEEVVAGQKNAVVTGKW